MRPLRRLVTAGAAIAAVATLAGCADKDPSSPLRSMATGKPRMCYSAPLETTKVIDESTLLMIDSRGNGALVKMSSTCLIDSTAPVIMKYHGTTDICGPLDVDISGSVTGGIPTPCIISTISPLSKEQTKVYQSK